MTREPRTCNASDMLNRAAQILWEEDCGCVPVVNADGIAVGVITDRDICMAAYTQGKPLSDIPVHVAASRGLIGVSVSATLDQAQSIMRDHRIRRLPVLDFDGHVVGILSLNDIARRAHVGHRRGELDADHVVKTLAAICAPPAHDLAAE
jgi:CBS domain-containing protein